MNLLQKGISGFRHNNFCMYETMDTAWDDDNDDTNVEKRNQTLFYQDQNDH